MPHDRTTTPSSEDSLGIDIRKTSDQMLAHWLLKQLCGYNDSDIVSDRMRDESFVAEIIGRVRRVAVSESARRCLWLKDVDGIFHTDCGHELCYDATLKDCGVKFCQCCGGEVKGVPDDE